MSQGSTDPEVRARFKKILRRSVHPRSLDSYLLRLESSNFSRASYASKNISKRDHENHTFWFLDSSFGSSALFKSISSSIFASSWSMSGSSKSGSFSSDVDFFWSSSSFLSSVFSSSSSAFCSSDFRSSDFGTSSKVEIKIF